MLLPRFRRRFMGIRGRMSPRNYLTYTVLLGLIAAGLVYAGVWALAVTAKLQKLQPGDPGFDALAGVGLAAIGAFSLWSLTAMTARRARDAHIPTLGFKIGLPALVLIDHFGVAQLTNERLMWPLDAFTPFLPVGLAAVFALLLLTPRAAIRPLPAVERDEAEPAPHFG
jgi:uncharacterized membrane protein YhaH (DUF805 family)